ncbi:undecaprenyl-phosphate alpha-N-acetylglucosaminyl 1-phosphate transferase [Spirochaetia bacterium]|nr:undecaprenyl-phosphate alpha-N-acetylglucosaminyl 1-phosphate transferase [Spirochaetia bacterium]
MAPGVPTEVPPNFKTSIGNCPYFNGFFQALNHWNFSGISAINIYINNLVLAEYFGMSESVIILVSSFVFSGLAVALILRLARKKAWYDHINERKIHTGDVPRLGGVGFALVFVAAAFFINFSSPSSYFGLRFLPSLLALILTLIMGVMDDFKPVAPRYKLIIHIFAALCVIVPGYGFDRLFFFNMEGIPFFPVILVVLSFFWLVGLTNAVNFVDGSDGLAGGISTLTALSYALIFNTMGNTGAVVLFCGSLAAAIGGFLIFNLPIPRAKIFMGDGGAYFLGLTLALLPLISAEDGNGLPLLYAAALLIIPIFDAFSAIWRRIRDKRRIDSPDRSHIHHKLFTLGFNAAGVAGTLYGLQIIISILVFLSVKFQGILSLVFLGAAYLVGIGFFSCVHFLTRAALAKTRALKRTQGA